MTHSAVKVLLSRMAAVQVFEDKIAKIFKRSIFSLFLECLSLYKKNALYKFQLHICLNICCFSCLQYVFVKYFFDIGEFKTTNCSQINVYMPVYGHSIFVKRSGSQQ